MLDQAQLQGRDDGVGAEHGGLVVEAGVDHPLHQPPLVLPLRGVQVGGDTDGQVARRHALEVAGQRAHLDVVAERATARHRRAEPRVGRDQQAPPATLLDHPAQPLGNRIDPVAAAAPAMAVGAAGPAGDGQVELLIDPALPRLEHLHRRAARGSQLR